jgi:hypothetical protein
VRGSPESASQAAALRQEAENGLIMSSGNSEWSSDKDNLVEMFDEIDLAIQKCLED